jgi:hypothetical protein
MSKFDNDHYDHNRHRSSEERIRPNQTNSMISKENIIKTYPLRTQGNLNWRNHLRTAHNYSILIMVSLKHMLVHHKVPKGIHNIETIL